MAHEKFEVVSGPGIWDLSIALFDHKPRALSFVVIKDGKRQTINVLNITSVSKVLMSSPFFMIKGLVGNGGMYKQYIIQYRSDTRKGTMFFDGDNETIKVQDDDRKARALMIIIEKMVAGYQNYHSERGYEQDEEFFKLYNKAKGVNFAKSETSLTEAIKQI